MGKLFRKLFPSKKMREFNKMRRKHRKELVKLAKETREWDYHWLYESMLMQIRHMHEYYSKGNNVWQVDESRLEIVEQLQHVLDLAAKIEEAEENNCGLEFVYKEDKLVDCIKPDDYKEKILEQNKQVCDLYIELYSSIGKNLRKWWD